MPRLCEMTLPEVLVARLEQLPGGMAAVLSRVEREFGLSTTSAHVGNRKYAIVGPNPDILELAIETLQRRFTIYMYIRLPQQHTYQCIPYLRTCRIYINCCVAVREVLFRLQL